MSEMERIVLFAPHYAEYSMRLARALSQRHEVLLFVERHNRAQECGDRFDGWREGGLRVVEFDSFGRSARIRSCLTILGHLLRFRPTFINVQEEEGIFTSVVTAILRRFAPIVLTAHDPTPHTGADADYAAANVAHQRATRARASAFHVHGDHCRAALTGAVGDTRPILSTQHAVVLEPEPAERRSPAPGRLLMFGRMEAYKGLEILLDAADRLRGRGVAFTLVLAGRGSEIDRLRGRWVGRPDVEVMDHFLTVDQAIEQFQRASLVVLPYLNATQSGVVAAAFANGRPVVAARVGGLADSVRDGDNGLLVAPGDPGGVADAIESVLGDAGLLSRLNEGAARAAATDFAWSRVADALVGFVEEHRLTRRRRP